jgi:hypothetical protein
MLNIKDGFDLKKVRYVSMKGYQILFLLLTIYKDRRSVPLGAQTLSLSGRVFVCGYGLPALFISR